MTPAPACMALTKAGISFLWIADREFLGSLAKQYLQERLQAFPRFMDRHSGIKIDSLCWTVWSKGVIGYHYENPYLLMNPYRRLRWRGCFRPWRMHGSSLSHEFDAVIGVGGKGEEPWSSFIDFPSSLAGLPINNLGLYVERYKDMLYLISPADGERYSLAHLFPWGRQAVSDQCALREW